jgi:hypothetical protein
MLYINTRGDAVEWAALDDTERRFYGDPPPWVVTEFGMTLAEYVAKVRQDDLFVELSGSRA